MTASPTPFPRRPATRDDWIDYVKAMGIILVVLGHVVRGLRNAGIPMDERSFFLADSIVYSFHMPLFFFVSGLTLAVSLERQGAGGFIIHKGRSLVYPYVIWSLLLGFASFFLSRFTNRQTHLAEIFTLLWQPRDQLWFLYALFLITVLLAMLLQWFGLQRRWQVMLLCAGGFVFHEYRVYNMLDSLILSFAVFVMLGVCFGDIKVAFQRSPGRMALFFGALAVIGQILFHGPFHLSADNDKGWVLPLATLCILALAGLGMWMERLHWGWLLEIGRQSMAIFLMHVLFGSGIRIVLDKFLGQHGLVLHLLAGMAFGVLLPMLAYRALLACHAGFLFVPPHDWGFRMQFARLRR